MISVKTLYRWKGLSLTHYNRDKTLTDWIKASKTRQLLERVLDPHSCHHQEKGELCKLCNYPCEAGIIKASEFKVLLCLKLG